MSARLERREGFPTTDWQLLRNLQSDATTNKQEFVHELTSRYWPAMRHYLLTAKRMGPDEADEVRSAFTVDKLLAESQLFDRADAARGKFRTFLIRSLENFLIDRRRRNRPTEALSDLNQPPSTVSMVSPAAAFDRAWAQSVLAEALQLTEAWLQAKGRQDSWEIFKARIVLPATEGTAAVDFATLIARHRLKSAVQASNLLTSARRVFVRKLATALSRYADESQDFKSQLDELRRIF